MNNKQFKVLSIIGSPHNKNSNTRALIEDFVEELSLSGVKLTHEVITLGHDTVKPCRGCWNCTKELSCPVKDDSLGKIKEKMLQCDMLILGSPVYTNQVSAQTKALFDRLFTWCHIFPLLGKYSLSAVTTANDGHRETGDFLEKILATYGTFSFGTLVSTGGYTPGFFTRRDEARKKSKKIAQKAARFILQDKLPPQSAWLKKMFTVMKRKMSGVHAVNHLVNGPKEGIPEPSKIILWLLNKAIKKRNVPREDTVKLSKLMQFELNWWTDKNWLTARSLKDLLKAKPVKDFNVMERLLSV